MNAENTIWNIYGIIILYLITKKTAILQHLVCTTFSYS